MAVSEECRKVSYAIAKAFLIADEMAHDIKDADSITQYSQWLDIAAKSLQGTAVLLGPHLEKKAIEDFVVTLADVEESIKRKDADKLVRSAKKIQEIVLSEGLPSLVVQCSPRKED